MCRLYAFRASEPTKVECSLIYAQNALLQQSRRDEMGDAHPDGWGIGYYVGSKPVLVRREFSAFEDLYFAETAEKIYSKTVVAHVRRASVGKPLLVNTHPFSVGVWTFAHNGTLWGFEELEERIVAETDPQILSHRRGTTDSEACFLWLLSRMKQAGISTDERCTDLERLSQVVCDAVTELAQRSQSTNPEEEEQLNWIVTDGVTMVATRWNRTLHWVFRENIRDCEICGIPHVNHDQDIGYNAVIIASEQISQEDWQQIPNFSILTLDNNFGIEIRPIGQSQVVEENIS